MGAKLIWATPEAEKLVAYCARVSSPNQENPEIAKLIKYLIKNKHWSPLEMANMCVEIETTRAISPQILRHRSFSFQEFSLRYAEAAEFEIVEARRQDSKNRQNSIADMNNKDSNWFREAQDHLFSQSRDLYSEALRRGIAKEQARALLPLSTKTKLYMQGSLRSWVHYLEVRCDKATQKEHRDVADSVKAIFIEQFPIISEALGWTNAEEQIIV